MKSLLLFFLFLPPAFACKGRLPDCGANETTILLPKASLEKLRAKVNSLQQLLNKNIKNVGNHSSCYNNNFAPLFLGQIREESCASQLASLAKAVETLSDEASPEWKSVENPQVLEQMRPMAKEVLHALQELPH